MDTMRKLLKLINEPDYDSLKFKIAGDAPVVAALCLLVDAIDRQTTVLENIQGKIDSITS